MTYTYDEASISLDAPLTKGEFLHFINTRFNPLEEDVSNIRLEMKSMAEMIMAAIQGLEKKWDEQLKINNYFADRLTRLEAIGQEV
ncbi:MAG: hypothetical protein RIQ72_534 [Candidatus Parcubacteria bacterium]|jgi:hypothetical protein